MQNRPNVDTTAAESSSLILTDRSSLEITGVDEVISYDEKSIELVVGGVKTVIEGEMLKVTRLSVSEGIVCAHGKVCAVIYDDTQASRKGFLASLLGR